MKTHSLLSSDLEKHLSSKLSLWETLRGKRIFITGGTGFFGCWFLESFLWMNKTLKLNASLQVLTRNKLHFLQKYPYFADHAELSFCEGDIRNFVFPEEPFSYIIHAATDTSIAADPLQVFDSILMGTRRILDFARFCQAEKILLTSSGAVYGKHFANEDNSKEADLCALELLNNKSTYAIGKCAAEQLAFLYATEYGLEVKIARCFAFVGPYLPLNGHFAIGNFIKDALQGGPIQIQGDGSPLRSYLYAADLITWLWTILLEGKTAYPYNVGSDEAYNLQEIAHLVASTFDAPIAVQVALAKASNVPSERYIPNINRVRDELQLSPITSLKEAIQLTKEWHTIRQ